MKHLIRIFLILIAFLFFLAGMAVLSFHLFFPPVKLQRMAVDGIRGFFNREARIERLAAGFTGLTVKNFAVSEYPDFKAGTFFKGDELLLRWQLLPLLQHRMAISEARLVAPYIEIYRYPSGEYNYRAGFPPHAADAPPKALLFPALLVSELNVQDGTVLFKDSSIAVRHGTLSTRAFSLLAPFNAEVAFTLEKEKLRADIFGTAAIDVQAQTIEFKDAALRAAGKPALRFTGSISGFTRPDTLRFSVTVSGDRTAFESLTALVPALSALQFFTTPAISLTLTGTPENISIKFNK